MLMLIDGNIFKIDYKSLNLNTSHVNVNQFLKRLENSSIKI